MGENLWNLSMRVNVMFMSLIVISFAIIGGVPLSLMSKWTTMYQYDIYLFRVGVHGVSEKDEEDTPVFRRQQSKNEDDDEDESIMDTATKDKLVSDKSATKKAKSKTDEGTDELSPDMREKVAAFYRPSSKQDKMYSWKEFEKYVCELPGGFDGYHKDPCKVVKKMYMNLYIFVISWGLGLTLLWGSFVCEYRHRRHNPDAKTPCSIQTVKFIGLLCMLFGGYRLDSGIHWLGELYPTSAQGSMGAAFLVFTFVWFVGVMIISCVASSEDEDAEKQSLSDHVERVAVDTACDCLLRGLC